MGKKFTIATDAEGFSGEMDLYENTYAMRMPDGRLVTMDLGQGDVHIDAALANYASGYHNAEMAADTVMPVVTVPKASDYYFEFNPDDALATVDGTQVAAGANVPEVSPKLSNNRFATLGYALGAFVPIELVANQDSPLNLEMKSVRTVLDRLLLNREVRAKAIMFLTGNYTGAHLRDLTGSPGTLKWNGGTASDPVADIQGVQEAALMPITDALCDLTTWNALTRNPNVQKYTGFKQAVQGLPSPDQRAAFAAFLNLPRIHVCEARSKSSTGSYPYVWAGDMVLFRRPPMDVPVDGMDIATAKTFRWTGGNAPDAGGAMPAGYTSAGGITIRSFFNPYRGKKGGTQIVVSHDDAEQFISQNVGGLIHGCIQ